MICVNDEQLSKAKDLIEVTEEGIMRCDSYKHPEKTFLLIEVTEEGIVIFVNDEHF